MTELQIKVIFESAPKREFENGPKLKGYFAKELKKVGIEKRTLRKLIKKGFLKTGHVRLREGTQNFYSLA